MQETALKYILYVLFALVGLSITFYVFGAELPLYLILAFVGLFLHVYSPDPVTKFIGGWVGRIAAVLFFVSLLYYIGTKSFFPEKIFEFKFLALGVKLVGDQSNTLGELVLNLFR